MNGRSLLMVALLVALPLAGCLGGGEDEPVTDAATDDALNTDAPEGRGTIAAFEETNKTEEGVGGVDHHHDYWQGRDRALVFETDAMMEPFPADDNKAVATFRPPQGTFVYEATERVEFFITNPRRHACEPFITFGGKFYCTDYVGEGNPAAPAVEDPNPPQGLILRYKHAATTQWIDAGELTWDQPLPIQITNPIQTDMPHATSSVWEFQVVSPNAHDITLVFTAKAEMVRGGEDIPMWPGHPLFYDEERTYRDVVQNVETWACDNGFSNTGCAVAGGEVGPVFADKIVSYGTRTAYVWVNITDVKKPSPASEPLAWFLYHRNATGRENITNPFDTENYGIEKTELFWILPVDDNGMDSPYADGSRWNFELGASYRTPDNPVRNLACYGGCADWAAKYTMHVRVTPEELAPDQYHLYCLEPDVYCGEQ